MTTDPRTPDGGPPSAEACADVAAALQDELAGTRLAWEAALLRSDAALAAGDPTEIDAALDEQRAVLADLERRVRRSLAAAIPSGSTPAARGAVPTETSPQAATTPPDDAHARRGRTPALTGAFAGLALVAGLWGTTAAPTSTPSTSVVAAGDATATEAVVELRAAASDVVRRAPLVITDVAGPTRDAGRFSASLPASATRAAPPTEADTEGTADTAAAPAAPTEEPEPAPPSASDTAESPPPEPTTPDAPDEPVDELLPDLPGAEEDGPGNPEVASRAPASLVDLADEVRRILEPPPASDRAPGLR